MDAGHRNNTDYISHIVCLSAAQALTCWWIHRQEKPISFEAWKRVEWSPSHASCGSPMSR